MGLTVEQVAQALSLSVEDVERLGKGRSHPDTTESGV